MNLHAALSRVHVIATFPHGQYNLFASFLLLSPLFILRGRMTSLVRHSKSQHDSRSENVTLVLSKQPKVEPLETFPKKAQNVKKP